MLTFVLNVQIKINEFEKKGQFENSSDKKQFTSRSAFSLLFQAGSLQFSLLTVKYTKLFRSNFRNVFHCLKENIKETLLCDLFSLNSCEAARGVCKMKAASAKQRRKFRRETHTPLWLLIGRTLFSLVKKPRSRFGLAVSLFSRVKNIVL